MKKISGLIVVLIAVLAAPLAVLASPPSIPLLVYGSVKIDGSLAPVGTIITAEIEDVEVASVTMTVQGQYFINVPDGKVNAGKMIIFKVNGIADDANQCECLNVATSSVVNFDLAVFIIEEPEQTPVSSSGGTSGGGGTPAAPSSVSSSDKPITVSSSQEGSLSQNLGDGNSVNVEIPKNSVSSKTTFTAKKGSITPDNTPTDSLGAFLVSDLVFNVNAKDSSGAAVRNFSENITITLTASDLPADTSDLGVYYFNETAGEWELVPGAVFSGNKITFQVNHLTLFAVFQVVNNEDNQETPKIPVVKGVSDVTVIDGDIIQCETSDNPFAVYIVKIVGDTSYIRHIVSLDIFNYYEHLKWEDLKRVDSLSGYSLSGWVRHNTGQNGTAGPTDKVYEINGDQTKHWINMTAEDFLAHGGSEQAIYSVNQGELDLYATGADVMSL